jgi:hypothetical protein
MTKSLCRPIVTVENIKPIACYGLLVKIINTEKLHNFEISELCNSFNDKPDTIKNNVKILKEMGYLTENEKQFKLNKEKVLSNCQVIMPFFKFKEV